jgi:LPS export ABC transporter protein LptC
MFSRSPKHAPRLLLAVLTIGVLWLTACENDLENIKKISNMNSGGLVDTTRGVDVIYSDSAVVKGRMITPLLIKYATDKPYYIMPDGVKVISFDKFGKEDGNIVADSAVQLENENITKFYKNVVVTTTDGSTFKSEEIIWDQPKKIFYSNKPFEMQTRDGQVSRGINFKSDDKLNHATWDNGTGEFDVTESGMQ